MEARTFAPRPAGTDTLAVTTSSDRTRFHDAGTGKPGSVRLYNAGSATVFCEFGGSEVVAAVASGFPLPAGGVETFNPQGGSYLAAITASGTATLYVTPGEGM